MTGDLTINAPAVVSFGSSVRQMLNLWDTIYGIGVQSDTLYQRTNNDFSWFRGGIHDNLRNNPGGDTEAMRLVGATSTLWLRPGTAATPRGRILFGDLRASDSSPYVSIGEAPDDDDTLDITAEKTCDEGRGPRQGTGSHPWQGDDRARFRHRPGAGARHPAVGTRDQPATIVFPPA